MGLVKHLRCFEISERLVIQIGQWYHWLHNHMLGNIITFDWNAENVARFLHRNVLETYAGVAKRTHPLLDFLNPCLTFPKRYIILYFLMERFKNHFYLKWKLATVNYYYYNPCKWTLASSITWWRQVKYGKFDLNFICKYMSQLSILN